jgi:hypothetical protein
VTSQKFSKEAALDSYGSNFCAEITRSFAA